MILYHGTTLSLAREIQRQGLIPKASRGCDYWSSHRAGSPVCEQGWSSSILAPSVYLTDTTTQAWEFAEYHAKLARERAAVVAVKICQSAKLKLDPDCQTVDGRGFRYTGIIPACDVLRVLTDAPIHLSHSLGVTNQLGERVG